MGEWQAWHPTVSRQSRSTDITDAFGPGTRWSAGSESYIDEVVAASPVFRVPSGPPARSPSGFAVPSGPGEPVLVPEGGGPPARSPHASLRLGVVDLEARPGPAAALRHPGMHPGPSTPFVLAARACRERSCPAAVPGHRGRGCVTGVPGAVGPARPLAVRATSRWLGASARSPARPCGPAGTLHTGGAGVS